MSKQFKVSVILPVYNTEKYIKQMLESLEQQIMNKNDFEVFIINDGSTDNSAFIINQFIKDNPSMNIKYIYQENAGVSAARNLGLSLVTGDYVYMCDGDDIVDEYALYVMYKYGVANNADIVVGRTYQFNESAQWPVMEHNFDFGIKNITCYSKLTNSFATWNKLFRREFAQSFKFIESLSLGEDACYMMEAYLKAKIIYTVDAVVYYYRQTSVLDKSLTSKCITNPNGALEDLFYQWKHVSQIIEETIDNKYSKKFVYSNYFDRFMKWDLYNCLNNSIITNDVEIQNTTYTYLNKMISSINPFILDNIPNLFDLCFKKMLSYYKVISDEAKQQYMEILIYVINNLNSRAYFKLEQEYPNILPILKTVVEEESFDTLNTYLKDE